MASVWEYTPVLVQDVQILLNISSALLATLLGPFSLSTNLLTLKLLVFNVLLPCACMANLGFEADMRQGEAFWKFVGCFLMLRALMLLVHVAWAALRRLRYEDIAVNWLVTCWVSSSILAPPLMKAVFGAEAQAFAVWGDASAYLFQLPVSILFFELDGVFRPEEDPKIPGQMLRTVEECCDDDACAERTPFYRKRLSRGQAKELLRQLAKKPLNWALIAGVLFSATTLGPRYLYPGPAYNPNCDFVEYTGFIYLFFESLARCLEPLALFSVGIVLTEKNPLSCGLWNIAGYMGVKLIFVPLLMIGCAFAVGLSGSEGRAAVLISVLPVSPPAFALTGHYGVGLSEAVSCVLVGKILVIPSILAWQAILDSLGVFTYESPPGTTYCSISG
jgi:predicted permease